VTNERKTVWILGAGFSKPLGGPLLDELLSSRTINVVQSLYASNPHIGKPSATSTFDVRDAAEWVPQLFSQFGPAAPPGTRLWSDAEAFLDHLDAAATTKPSGPAALRFQSALNEFNRKNSRAALLQLGEIRAGARRLVAADCCGFLKDAALNEEVWQPYLSWSRALSPDDSVITFNYDRALELLALFEIVDPSKKPLAASTKPQVFKLHGSVDWRRSYDASTPGFSPTDREEFALECEPEEIGIATPGPTKRVATEELHDLWEGALERIKAADAVVFIGYRFPPNDSEARGRILSAIRDNRSKHLELHFVLGPKRDENVERLEQMLRYVALQKPREEARVNEFRGLSIHGYVRETFRVSPHALWAQDFFTVWNRALLWPFEDEAP